jgi:hypothetical protein
MMLDKLDRMFQCGEDANFWLRLVITEGPPTELMEEWHSKLTFISAFGRDGFRINAELRKSSELVFLAEHIILGGAMSEDHPVVRYFMFAALHEAAHAIRQHRPPNEISAEESQSQEDEADALAFEWFNEYIAKRDNQYLRPLIKDEVEKAQARNQRLAGRQRTYDL